MGPAAGIRATWRMGRWANSPSRTTSCHTLGEPQRSLSRLGSAATNAPLSALMLVPSTRSA